MYSAQLEGQSLIGDCQALGVDPPVWASPVERLGLAEEKNRHLLKNWGWDMMIWRVLNNVSVKVLYKKMWNQRISLIRSSSSSCRGFRRDSRKGVSGLCWPWCYCLSSWRQALNKFQQLWLKQVFSQKRRYKKKGLSMGLTSFTSKRSRKIWWKQQGQPSFVSSVGVQWDNTGHLHFQLACLKAKYFGDCSRIRASWFMNSGIFPIFIRG